MKKIVKGTYHCDHDILLVQVYEKEGDDELTATADTQSRDKRNKIY
jgi:hypothetical protein